jgi:hypothetical protein
MATDLSQHISQLTIIDTHEHMRREAVWRDKPRDVLADLFDNYVPADFITAGAEPAAVKELTNSANADIEGRFAAVRDAWNALQFTGYGEAVRLIARHVYGMDEITPKAIRAAQPTLDKHRQPGGRLHLLRDVANLDHIQTDDFTPDIVPDASGPEFFLYDIGVWTLCNGTPDFAELLKATGVTVTDLASLRQAMATIFERYAAMAIAVKSQHAYARTLQWEQRTDEDAAKAFSEVQQKGKQASEPARLCLGDWAMDTVAELAAEHDLPFKIHTGYYAGTGYMHVDRIKPGNLCKLLIKHPKTRWVLMHTAYPYGNELIAIAKHFPNVWVDLCWAWSIDPLSTQQFIRTFIHTVPANKLFGFGGDTSTPTSAVGYTLQARQWLTRTLQAEVADGLLSETQAIDLATRFMRGNQLACFNVERSRASSQQALAATR